MYSNYRLTALAVCALSVAASAQQLMTVVPGSAGEAFGTAMVDAGDQNGDGFQDVLVGAPLFFFGDGAIYCMSGAYLKTGTGPSLLWSLQYGSTQGSYFGTSLANVGDVTGDGVADFAVGAPGYDIGPFGVNAGAVYLISGATHFFYSVVYGSDGHYSVDANRYFGQSLATVGDINGDGKAELAVGMPGDSTNSGGVYVIPGTGLASGGYAPLLSIGGAGSGATFGTSLASGVDFNGDGKNDIVVGSPAMPAFGSGVLSGYVDVISATGSNVFLGHYKSTVDGDRLGASVSAASDYDGDGKVDIVAGAPLWTGTNGSQYGRVLVLSGSKLLTNTAPKELYTLDGSFLNNSVVFFSIMDGHFGAAVRATADLNNDGVGDFLVGAPDYRSVFPISPMRGAVAVYSGASGMWIGGATGANSDHLGDSLLGAVQDLDGDGFREFVVAGSISDNPSTDCGTVKCYRLFPSYPTRYCTGKVNSLGCTPSISASGIPSVSSTAPFLVTASSFINQQLGLMIYSNHATATPFQGGTLCVRPPTKRTPVQVSGGSTTGSDCTGTYSFDFGARIHSGVDLALAAGAEAFCQYWARDPQSPSTTSLSNGLRLLINP